MKHSLGISSVSIGSIDLQLIEAYESDMKAIYSALGVPKHFIVNKPRPYKMVRKIIRDKRFSRPIVYYKKVLIKNKPGLNQ